MKSPHLAFAHRYWAELVKPGDAVIDATCGNGHDTLRLAKLVLGEQTDNFLYALDCQKNAIEATHAHLAKHLTSHLLNRIKLVQTCHSSFPADLAEGSIRLIVYNLGYLPGSDKKLTTQTETTIASLKQALKLLQPGGAISITCYPGHAEGEREEKAILEWASLLDLRLWSCVHHRWINRLKSPSLLVISH